MSIFTRNKVFFAADKRTYWEYDPGGNSGNGDATLIVNDKEVMAASTDSVIVAGGVTASGAVLAAGRLAAEGGMSWSVEGSSVPIAAASSLSLDKVVSIVAPTAAGVIFTLPAPSSAGIVKIIANNGASTAHIDFSSAALISGFATASNINMLPGGDLGLISLTTIAWQMMWPTTVATVLVTTLAT